MKLKYFLRGLASGIVVTTLILTISFSAREDDISEQEIMERAEKLGMVMAEDKDLLSATVTPASEAEVTEAVAEATPELTEEPKATVAEEEEASVTPEPTVTEEPKATATPTPEPTEEPKATATPTPEPVQSSSEKKVLTITSGMWSDKVARELEAMGVIEDAADFDQYLVRNGYAERLVVGTFEIPAGATYDQIAQIITSR